MYLFSKHRNLSLGMDMDKLLHVFKLLIIDY
jgi:hypothetical protein